MFTGCPNAKTCTLILRGGAEQFLEETERSLHDAIMIVRRTIKNDAVVAGNNLIIIVVLAFIMCRVIPLGIFSHRFTKLLKLHSLLMIYCCNFL